MTWGFWIDKSALGTVGADLDSEAARVRSRVDRLGVVPDAGRTTDEAGRTIVALTTAVANAAANLADLATALAETVRSYEVSDARVAERLYQVGSQT